MSFFTREVTMPAWMMFWFSMLPVIAAFLLIWKDRLVKRAYKDYSDAVAQNFNSTIELLDKLNTFTNNNREIIQSLTNEIRNPSEERNTSKRMH